MRRSRLLLSSVLALAALAGVAPASAAQRPAAEQAAAVAPSSGGQVGDFVGVSLGGEFNTLSDAEAARSFDAIRAAGATWVRMDFGWAWIEQQRGRFDFWAQDRFVRMATERGLRVLGILTYTPPWARVAGCAHFACAPASAADYATFVTTAVRRFAPLGVRTWELWNEPNIQSFWKPAPDPEAYAALVRAGYAAAKAADPGSTVLAGAMSPAGDHPGYMAPTTFLRRLYAAGAGGSFDALSFHPYSFPVSPTNGASWNAFSTVMPNLRSIMVAAGDGGKKIWSTEYGAPTSGQGGVSEAEQAAFVDEAFTALQRWDWAGPIFWYSFRDLGGDPSDRENSFGVVRHDWSPKPALAAFTAATARPATGPGGSPTWSAPGAPPVSGAARAALATRNTVKRLYQAYFLRDVDPGGQEYWLQTHQRGANFSAISHAFTLSPEFQAMYGRLDTGQFVHLVYRNVLRRAPEPAGFAYWYRTIAEGWNSRGGVMLGFADSPEFKAIIGIP